MRQTAGWLAFNLILLIGSGCSPVAVWTDGEVPFVPTPPEVVDRMLEMAQVKSGDVIYDLGSGDGRIIIRADHLVEFRVQDALSIDVSPATVVTLYMLPEFNAKLRPIFDKQLKPGSRVVSHDFEIQGWVPDKVERIKGDFLHDHTILLFEVN